MSNVPAVTEQPKPGPVDTYLGEKTDQPTLIVHGVQFVVGILTVLGVGVSTNLHGAIETYVQSAVVLAGSGAYFYGTLKNWKAVSPAKYTPGHD